jgi:hypothetical protein
VLHSITVEVSNQQQLDSVLLYLDKHGQHVDSIQLMGIDESTVDLGQLPSNLQLSSLELSSMGSMGLQLLPGGGFQGVLGAAAGSAALKQLKLGPFCEVLDQDADAALAAALSQLPARLEHLGISGLLSLEDEWVQFDADVLPRLQQLTYLELADIKVKAPGQGQPALQPLQALTALQDLRLWAEGVSIGDEMITASMLSGMHHLTRLEVSAFARDSAAPNIEPGILAGKPLLQHLELEQCIVSGAAGGAQLLSHLQPLQQLTHLDLQHTTWEDSPPAAACAALTASSKLQHLDISGCTLPGGAWEHMFRAARQLPHLTSLDVGGVSLPEAEAMPGEVYVLAPFSCRLVSCCPGLQSLNVQFLQHSALLLAQLQGLTGLHTLHCSADMIRPSEGVGAVCRLTGLRQLDISVPHAVTEELLLPLAQLQQLTSLTYFGVLEGDRTRQEFSSKVRAR